MKQLHIASIASIFTITIFIFTALISCNKNKDLIINGTNIQPCKNMVCYNGGSCLDGSCVCPAGFEGADCSIKWNERYVGVYSVTDACKTDTSYAVTINQVINNASQILVKNISTFANNVNLIGTITPNKTTVNFAPQLFGNNIYVSGIATQTEAADFINCWLVARDSNNHTSKNCSISLRKN